LLELGGAQPGAVFSIPVPGALIGRNGNAQVTLSDVSVSWEHARLTLNGESAFVVDLSSRNGTFVNNEPVKQQQRLSDGDYLRLGRYTVLKFSMVDEFEENALRTLFELTLRDPLTRLYNRRYFDDRLLGEFAFAQRHRTVLGLLLIDIDHFKQINDTCGHQVGDIVLKLVTQSIQKMMRPEDVLARYGGEEFIVIVRATSLRNMEILGTRICQRIQALPLNLQEHNLNVTVSVGVSCMGPDAPCTSAEVLLTAADEALYRSKASGRNRTSVTHRPGGQPTKERSVDLSDLERDTQPSNV
jgi:diguanylate cyclase (GGDEF)-like protein